ncbi:hybrid sensor histidine kinase/response regulator [Archangium primigenium]|uniref:hybrid sensor histidine kinase/response regulator n=1 Tax=[Archangium] primigenium TaxID=2792470 RepID=UPI001959AEAE|nr:PAS domain S-box protein [Archangium primigenium]
MTDPTNEPLHERIRTLEAEVSRQRAILRSSVDFAIVVTDLEARVTDWNRGAEQILGWTAEEMLGEKVDRFFTPEDLALKQPEKEMRQSVEKGRAADERWHLRKGEVRLWAAGEMMPLRDEDGTHRGYVKILRDRTPEHLAGEALRRSEVREDRYRTVLDSLEVGFCIIEVLFAPDGKPVDYVFLDKNLAFERQTGLSDVVGRRMREFAPEHEQHWYDVYGQVARTGVPVRFENRAESLAGRWYEVHALRLGAAGENRVAVLFNDVSQRKRMEDTLRELNANLAQQVEERTRDRDRLWRLSSDLMLVARFDGAITAVNPAWTEMLGWSEAELVGRSLFELVHPDDQTRTAGGANDISEGRALWRFENRYRHKDGSYRWISWTAGPGDGFMVAVGRDITAEKAREETLAKTEEQLRQAQKMEAVGQLTGGLAHDFNNLLTGITGSLELLSIRIAQGRLKELDRYTAAAQGAASRAAALTHRLLAFSRRQTLDPKPVDANRLVEGMADLIRRTVGPEVLVTVSTADGLWSTEVDPHQLENALLNLCINARDAMPGGGRLTIETNNRVLDARVARINDMQPGSYIVLCVSDTGTGMPPDVIAKAFDPFFTTKPLGAGTGLGLSMIYGFTRQSGGHVSIYSEVGNGTTVCLFLPRHLGEAKAEDAAPQLSEAPRAEVGETVLVVDDEAAIRMLVTDVLEELGYRAIEAADGASGLKVLRSEARIDLLVTDVGLPGGMNGRQMADAGRVHRPGLKVLFITGYAEAAVVGHGHLEPGMHVMTKPFPMEALATRIRTLISGE